MGGDLGRWRRSGDFESQTVGVIEPEVAEERLDRLTGAVDGGGARAGLDPDGVLLTDERTIERHADELARIGVHLGVVCAGDAGQVAGDLDHHVLEAAAGPEQREVVLSGVADRLERARHACTRRAGRHQAAAIGTQHGRVLEHHRRGHPFDFIVDLGQLEALQALADHETVTAAARVLHLSPSAVSQQIAALARSVGVPLVTRHGRRVRLTAQAVVLLDHARVVEAQLERARTDLAAFDDGDVGNVTVGAFATTISGLVAPALGLLSTDRPRLAVP